MITRVKGTQDFLDTTLYSFIIHQISTHLRTYHFTEISLPLLEPVELFQRLLGEHTDVVHKEMYILESSKEAHDPEKICLRPEATASIARAFVENGIQNTPWKVFTHGAMFRHERPQKGRYRQFHQVSMEVIGSASVAQDVQLIGMLDRFFHDKLQLNNYALLLNFLGCHDDFMAYKKILHAFLEKEIAHLCEKCLVRKEVNVMRTLDCKNEKCQEIYRKAPEIARHLCASCTTDWQQVQEQLNLLSISFVYKPTLVRGLDYYSKTVFEFVSDNLGAQNTFCAGGRYDNLITQVGGKEPQPAVGAAFGIERLMLLLEPLREKLPLVQEPALHVVIPLAAEQQTLALLIADELRAHALCTDVLVDLNSAKNMMRKAGKMAAAYCLLLGEDEQKNNTVMVKNMITGAQEQVAQADVVTYLKK